MNEAGMIAGGHGLWSDLRGDIGSFLEREGLSPRQAERCSHEIVVRCASEPDETGALGLRERAMAEAETLLIGWRAGRGGRFQEAA